MLAPLLAFCCYSSAALAPAQAQDARRPRRIPTRSIRRRPARSIRRRCRRSQSRIRRQLRPRNCSRRKPTPFPGPARSIGFYADGCLAGGVPCRSTGRPGKSCGCRAIAIGAIRRWSNFLERFANNAKKVGWNGLLVGDMSQPRGGPMISGHASHQVGLDADIWFTPMPDHVQTRAEREFNGAADMVAPTGSTSIRSSGPMTRTEMIRTAAEDPAVTRIFVNAAIKKAMCREAGSDRSWLSKVRPWWGHAEHFHVRIACPADSPNASRNRRRMPATVAATSLISGSRSRRCIRRRRFFRRSRNRA